MSWNQPAVRSSPTHGLAGLRGKVQWALAGAASGLMAEDAVMKLIGIGAGAGKAKSDGQRGAGAAFASTGGAAVDRLPTKEHDILGQRFERMAGAFDHVLAALGAMRSVESLVTETRQAIETEFVERRQDQAELAALRLMAEQSPLDLAAARQAEASAKARLSEYADELEALRVAHASLQTEARESQGECEQLKGVLAGERKTAADTAQTLARLNEQIVHLESDLASAQSQIEVLEARGREAEATAAAAERARGLLDADLGALRRRHEQTDDELLRSNRRVVELEAAVSTERAKVADLEAGLAASRDEVVKLSRQMDQQAEAASSQANLAAGRLETLQVRTERQEEQIGELARLVDDLTARERAAARETAEAKLMRNRAEERAHVAQEKLAAAEKEVAAAQAARQTAIARAEDLTRAQQLKQAELERFTERETALRQALQHLEQRMAAERANAEGRIADLSSALERERSERAVAEGSLETVRKDRATALARLARYDAGLAEAAPAELSAATAS